MERAELGHGSFHQYLREVGIRYIARDGDRFAACGLDCGDHLFGGLGVAIADNDSRAMLRKEQGRCRAYTASGAGDDGGLMLKNRGHGYSFCGVTC